MSPLRLAITAAACVGVWTALVPGASGLANPPCRLAISEVDGYRGQIELRNREGRRELAGYLSYRFPDQAISLREMAFASKVPMKLGLLLDFAFAADDNGRGADALDQEEVTDVRVFVGRLTGTSEAAYNKGLDILSNYRTELQVTGSNGANGPYVPAPQSRLGTDVFSFGGGDIDDARRIAAPLLGTAAAGRQLVSIKLVAGIAGLEAETKVTGFGGAAKRLLGGANLLRERAAQGRCTPGQA